MPKFLYYYYESQWPADLKNPLYESGPMVYIANYWKSDSPKDLVIFSNCDQVELFLNDTSMGKKGHDSDDRATAVLYPPFTFPHLTYAPGTLKAVGYLGNEIAATTEVKTPGSPVGIKLTAEELGRPLTADGADVVFIRAQVTDENGTLAPDAKLPITFSTAGYGTVVGDNPRTSVAGISSALLRAGLTPGDITVTASADGLTSGSLVIHSVKSDPDQSGNR